MTHNSSVYFPLRSNAKTLLQGASVNSMRNRLKLAALLHDEVYVEEGIWIANAGPRGSQDFWFYSDDPEQRKWQHPRSRGLAKRSHFSLALKPENDESSRFVEVLRSTTNISWHATFEPFKEELPPGIRWIAFGHISDDREVKRMAKRWIDRDEALQPKADLDRKFERRLITMSAYTDLLMSARIGSVVNMELFHQRLIHKLIQRGAATPVLGNHAIKVLYPSVGELSWSQIDELRKHSAIRYFRDTIREIEADALDNFKTMSDFESGLFISYTEALRGAQQKMESSFPSSLLPRAIGLVVGEATIFSATGIPLLGGIAGVATESMATNVMNRFRSPKWLSFDDHLRKATQQTTITS